MRSSRSYTLLDEVQCDYACLIGRPDRMLSVVALAFDYGVGRTYIIYYFAPAVIVIRFKTLNNNKNQLLTRTFSTTFLKKSSEITGPRRRYSVVV